MNAVMEIDITEIPVISLPQMQPNRKHELQSGTPGDCQEYSQIRATGLVAVAPSGDDCRAGQAFERPACVAANTMEKVKENQYGRTEH